jgi:hypothetical protein
MAVANTNIPNREIVNLLVAGKSMDKIIHSGGCGAGVPPERFGKPAECRLAESGAGR